jgi:hypothetical protein
MTLCLRSQKSAPGNPNEASSLRPLPVLHLRHPPRPEVHLAALPGPHPNPDLARNSAGRPPCQRPRIGGDGPRPDSFHCRQAHDWHQQRLAPHHDGLLAHRQEHRRRGRRLSRRRLSGTGHRSRRHRGLRLARAPRYHLCPAEISRARSEVASILGRISAITDRA